MSFTGKPTNFLETTIVNDGFFPNLLLGDFQRLYRVPAEYQQEKVEHLLRISMWDTNDDLAFQKNAWRTEGHDTLNAVPQETLGDKKALVEHYQRTVFARATATAFGEFATITRREIGESQAKESDNTAQMYRAQADRALRYLKGLKSTITVELL